ncbi:MAG: hypothetical protein R3253_05755 [Longimicrobiales bacterium]|nr:hypothetical protein [Longimicrobiales bacterium]
MSRAEEELWIALVAQANVPRPERQHRFHHERKWAFDFAWPGTAPRACAELVAVEMEGGVHRIRDRFERDVDKYNWAQLLGWVVLRVTPEMVRDGRAVALICRALGVEEGLRDSISAEELRS